MATRLTFKEYVESKQRLREAVKTTPKQDVQYSVRKYCKLVVNEDDISHVNLKPKHTITVKWLYENFENPTPISITFEGPTSVDSEQSFLTNWSGEQLEKWLSRNAHEIIK